MKTLSLSLWMIVLALSTANADDSVILGRALGHKYIEDVEMPCPPDYICMDGWFRWTIKPETTLSGPKLSGRIVAVRMQHTKFNPSYQKKLRLFVLTPIEDEEQRRLLSADYYLRDMSAANEMYCLDNETSYPAVQSEDRFTAPGNRDQYCFELPKEDEDG